ncbi:hypothetical protein ACWNYI_00375 [Candidatus Vidania fulgoroideorum]
MRNFYDFLYYKNIKNVLEKGKKILVYGKRDFFKIKIVLFAALKYENFKIRLFLSKKNRNFSYKFLKTLKKVKIIDLKFLKNFKILSKDNIYKFIDNKFVNIIYCLEDLSNKIKNFLINIIDKNIKNYFIFITFENFSKSCSLTSRLYKIKINDNYNNLEYNLNYYKLFKKNSNLILKNKIGKTIIFKNNIKEFLYYFIYFVTSRKNINISKKYFILTELKRIIKSKNSYYLFLLFIKINFL